jgi:hypothetical protein
MAERIDVMISSTARDLPDYRQQALDACVRQGMFPIMMEYLPAMDADAIQASLQMVDEAEIYLGIFARRYGYIPAGQELSITEMEYNRAVERGIPRLIFIVDDLYADDFEADDDPAKAIQQRALLERLKVEQVVNFFTSPADFRAQAINSLSRIAMRQSVSLHRASIIPEPPAPYIAHPYTLLESNGLFGRKTELELLTAWLTNRRSDLKLTRLLALVAIGGMGKSSLAWTWFNQLQTKSHIPLAGSLWWSFYESDAHYENFIARLLAYATGQSEEEARRKPLAQRETDLLTLLNQQPFLLVLDGLERLLIAYNRHERELGEIEIPSSAKGGSVIGLVKSITAGINKQHQRLRKTADPRIGVFLRKLATSSQSKVLITSRLYPADLETQAGAEIPGCTAVLLHGLGDEDALQLWRSFGVNGSDEALLELFHAFANYPLLIRALAGEVSRYRRAPKDFERWRTANPHFNPFELPMVQRHTHVLEFALVGLEEAEANVLRIIAAFNSPTSYGTLADLLVGDDKTFANEDELDIALTELEDRGVIGWDREANRYDLHPVIRGIIWNSLNKTDQRSLYTRLHDHLAASPKIDNWRKVKKLDELTPSTELYYTLVGLERYDEAADLLQNRLYRPLRYTFSNGQQLVALLELLFPDRQQLPPLRKSADQTWAIDALARAYQMTGQVERAVPLYEQSNQLKEAINYTNDLSTGWRDLSYAQRLVGRLHYAEFAARRALELDAQEENLRLHSLSLQVLGLALAARGHFEESAKALDYSLDLADRSDANRAYNHQAIRALWFGDHSAAFDWADKGMQYCKQKRLEAGLILANRLYGEAALGLNMLDLAQDQLATALAQARAVKLVEEEIAALIALAEVRRRHNQLELAREALDDVWEACETGPYRLLHADACNVLAHIERDANDWGAAVGAATRAYELAWCDGAPYSYHFGLRNAEHHLGVLNINPPVLAPFQAPQEVAAD